MTAPDAGGMGADLRGAAVLIVDDDALVRDAMVDMLAVLGARPVGASTVSEGLSTARNTLEPFDLVLVDLSMPDAAVDALALWRRTCPSARLVVVTGAGRAEAERRVGSGSTWTLLAKPFGMDDLLECLTVALATPDA